MGSERRTNILNGDRVLISPDRAHRPYAYIKARSSLSPENCPFCPGHENETTSETLAYRTHGSNRDDPHWWVRFIPNKYSAVGREKNGTKSHPLFPKEDAIGIHEIGITREHGVDFGEQGFDDKHNLTYELLWALHERKLSLHSQDPSLIFATFFKNRGEEAGGSLDHPHIQLIAQDAIPREREIEFSKTFEYHLKTGRCGLCDIVGAQLQIGDLIVDKNNDYIALEPHASRTPYETWIVPLNHEKSFSLTPQKANNLANILRKTFSRLNHLLKNPDYNFSIRDTPLTSNGFSDLTYHWYIEFSPRVTKRGGYEHGTGEYINPLLPEKAAENLRAVPV